MKWEKKGPMALISGEWVLAKYGNSEGFDYVLWQGIRKIGQFKTSDEAKHTAERLTE